jgi:hypothetical protein
MQGHPTRRKVIWAAVMHSVPEGSCVSWRTEDESGQPKALAVALSFCCLLGLGCPKQAFAKIATLFFGLSRSRASGVPVRALKVLWHCRQR